MAGNEARFDIRTEGHHLRRLKEVWTEKLAEPPPPVSGHEIAPMQVLEQRLRAEGRWIVGPATMLEVLGLQHDEVRNCRVIRWLLDPLAPHGIGTESLRHVLQLVSSCAAAQEIETPPFDDPSSAKVSIEEPRGHTRADIVIEGRSWTIVVEAKINAPEKDRQGQLLSDVWPGATYVYLSRKGGDMVSAGKEPWVSMRWRDLLSAIRETAGVVATAPPAGQRAQRAVQDYLEGARRLER